MGVDRVGDGSVRVTHIGGPTVLVEVAGWTILSDPTFDPPGRTYAFALGTSSTKLTGPALAEASLPAVDLVLVSHDHHADNLDDAGRALLPRARTVITTVPGARRLARTLDIADLRGLRAWTTTTIRRDDLPDLTITATPCRHGPPFSRPVVGSVVGFVLQFERAPVGPMWFSGDTVLYRGVRSVADRFDVDVAFVHFGDVRFGLTGSLHYSLNAVEGIRLIDAVGPNVAVPVHYEGWSHFHEGRAEIDRALAAERARNVQRTRGLESRLRFLDLGRPTSVR